MKQKLTQDIFNSLKIIILGLVIGFGVNYLSAAWTAPSTTPPGGNVDAPLNVGATAQAKNGSLTIGGSTVPTSSYKLNVPGLASFTGLVTQALTLPTGAGDGKVLTSDASGLASWQTISSSGTCVSQTTTRSVSTNSYSNQNNTSQSLFVTVTSRNYQVSYISFAYISAERSPTDNIDLNKDILVGEESSVDSTSSNNKGSFSFIVPAGYYYTIYNRNYAARSYLGSLSVTETPLCGGSSNTTPITAGGGESKTKATGQMTLTLGLGSSSGGGTVFACDNARGTAVCTPTPSCSDGNSIVTYIKNIVQRQRTGGFTVGGEYVVITYDAYCVSAPSYP